MYLKSLLIYAVNSSIILTHKIPNGLTACLFCHTYHTKQIILLEVLTKSFILPLLNLMFH